MSYLTRAQSLNPYRFNTSDFFDRFFSESESTRDPTLRVQEGESHYVIFAELPGVKKEDIKIDLLGQTLRISAERTHSGYSAKWSRELSLADEVTADRIEANYRDGILEIAVPKREAEKPVEIKISSNEGFFSRFFPKKSKEKLTA